MKHFQKTDLILSKKKASSNKKDQFLIDHAEMNKKAVYGVVATILLSRILQLTPKFILLFTF